MAEDIFPAQQPSFMGEWTYNSANTAPPATAQLRLNTSSQANATAIFFHNVTFNGINASAWLMEMIPGYVIRLEEKGTPARWHTFTVSGAPIQQSGYVELKVTWLAGGQNLTTSVMVSVISSVVRPTGNAMQASVGSAVASASIRIPVTSPGAMRAETSAVDVKGHILIPGMVYPFDTPTGFSLGMTLRQFYAAQALMGWVASTAGTPTANLIGKAAEFSFKAADNLIAFEKAEAAGKPETIVGRPSTIVGRPKLVG